MSDKVAVITGMSSGIGEATAQLLLREGWKVIGLSRRTPKFSHPELVHFQVDLCDGAAIETVLTEIIETHRQIDLVVNNAGLGHFAPHEELTSEQIEEMVHLNLLAPLLITRKLLRSLKSTRGWLVNISSFSAHENSSFGAAYAATKAGLRHFGNSLFDEVRKSGVKVLTISPDITKTEFFDHLSFSPEDDSEAFVTSDCIAESIFSAISKRTGTVVTELVVRPQRLLLKKHSKPR